MKKILGLALSLFSLSVIAQTTVLKLASDAWPPFTNVAGEKSFASDLVREALLRISIQSETEIVAFDEVINGIDAGTFHGSSALWESNERKKKYLFSSPYLQNQLILVGRKGSDVSATALSELTGKRIGIVKNYAYSETLNTSKLVILVAGESDQQNLERLLSEEIDYMLVDALLIQYMLKYQVNDVSALLEIAKKPAIVKSLHFALSKEIPEGKDILARFDQEIKNMITDGSYHRILELNWIRTDVDGDGQLELVLEGNKAGTAAPSNSYEVYLEQPDSAQGNSNQFYIDGNYYDSWDEVPQQYKVPNVKGNAINPNDVDPSDYGLKLRF